MKKRTNMHYVKTYTLFLALSLSLFSWRCSAPTEDSQRQNRVVASNQAHDFKPDVNITKAGWHGMPDVRFITGYMDQSYFTKEILKALFDRLAAEYVQPRFLNVYVYSDREMLRRMSRYLTNPPIGDMATDTGAYKRWVQENLPATKGYYRAYYTRNDTEDFFQYSPDPSREEMVDIRPK